MPERHFDVAVVGGGVAGCTLAAALADLPGLAIAVVEAREFPGTGFSACTGEHEGVGDFDARVSALTHASCSAYESMGVWPGVLARRCSNYRAMQVWDARGSAQIRFDAAAVGQQRLGCVVENSVLLSALLDHLAGRKAVTLYQGKALADASLAGGAAHLSLDGGTNFSAALLVAADGAQSPLREAMGFPVRRWDYGQDAIVCTVETTLPHGQTAWQLFTDYGPLAFLPLSRASVEGDQQLCSVVWSQSRHLARDLMSLNDADFCSALGDAFEHRLGDITAVSKRFSFPLRQHHAVDYVREGFALLADAAHGLHPLAGQGLNLGIADAMMLASVVGDCIAAKRAPGDLAALKRYQRTRKTDNLAMLAAIEGFHRVYQRDVPLPLRWLRNEGMRFVDRQQWLKDNILRYAMGV